jgi:hypothetical protein
MAERWCGKPLHLAGEERVDADHQTAYPYFVQGFKDRLEIIFGAPDDVHNPGQIVSEDREGHLGGYLWERFAQEVRHPHAGFHRAPKGCSTVSRHCRMA